MTIKSLVTMEVKTNERTYTFSMPVGAPFGEAYDAAFQVLRDITTLANQAVENASEKKETEG